MTRWAVIENYKSTYEGRCSVCADYETAKKLYEAVKSDGYEAILTIIVEGGEE